MLSRPSITEKQKIILKKSIQKDLDQIYSEISDPKQLLHLFWAILFDKQKIVAAVSNVKINPMIEVDDTLLDACWNISEVYEGKSNPFRNIEPFQLSSSDIKFSIAYIIYDEMKEIVGDEILSSYINYSIKDFKWLSHQISALSLFESQQPLNHTQHALLKFDNMHQALLKFEETIHSENAPMKQESDLDETDEALYRMARAR